MLRFLRTPPLAVLAMALLLQGFLGGGPACAWVAAGSPKGTPQLLAEGDGAHAHHATHGEHGEHASAPDHESVADHPDGHATDAPAERSHDGGAMPCAALTGCAVTALPGLSPSADDAPPAGAERIVVLADAMPRSTGLAPEPPPPRG